MRNRRILIAMAAVLIIATISESENVCAKQRCANPLAVMLFQVIEKGFRALFLASALDGFFQECEKIYNNRVQLVHRDLAAGAVVGANLGFFRANQHLPQRQEARVAQNPLPQQVNRNDIVKVMHVNSNVR